MMPLLATNNSIVPPKLEGDVGYDLRLRWSYTLHPGEVHQLAIGGPGKDLRLAIPGGYWGSVITRSGTLGLGIIVVPTVIDPGYRGPIYVFAYVIGDSPVRLHAGDRIAQLVLFPAAVLPIVYTDLVGLPPSQRGERGFGSTGSA